MGILLSLFWGGNFFCRLSERTTLFGGFIYVQPVLRLLGKDRPSPALDANRWGRGPVGSIFPPSLERVTSTSLRRTVPSSTKSPDLRSTPVGSPYFQPLLPHFRSGVKICAIPSSMLTTRSPSSLRSSVAFGSAFLIYSLVSGKIS